MTKEPLLDPYSFCPGGRSKKIRFCCSDMIKEMDHIVTMLQGGQQQAALSYIEQLEQSHPNCACLQHWQITQLNALDRFDEAVAVAEVFAAREPTNPTALTDLAFARLYQNRPEDALSLLLDAFELCSQVVETQHALPELFFEYWYLIACAFLATGNLPVASAMTKHLIGVDPYQSAGLSLRQRIANTGVPLILSEYTLDTRCPADMPEELQRKYIEAFASLVAFRWKKGVRHLEAMLEHATKFPCIWKNLAVGYLRIGETDKGIVSLRTFIASPETEVEERTNAVYFLSLLNPTESDILYPEVRLARKITDADAVLEKLLSHPQCSVLNLDLGNMGDAEHPAPRKIFSYLDKPVPPAGTPLTIENAPVVYGILILYGKETTRDARILAMFASKTTQEDTVRVLENICGEFLGGDEIDDTLVTEDRQLLLSQSLFNPQFPMDILVHSDGKPMTASELAAFEEKYAMEVALPKYMATPLPILGEKTPNEVVGDAGYSCRLGGLAYLLAGFFGADQYVAKVNTIRQKFGLSPLRLIDSPNIPADAPPEVVMEELDRIPVYEWYRMDVSKLSDAALLHVMRVMILLRDFRCVGEISEQVLRRNNPSWTFRDLTPAYETQIMQAQQAGNPELAMSWIRKTRAAAVAAGEDISDGLYAVDEFVTLLHMGNTPAADYLLQQIIQKYQSVPQVIKKLQDVLVRLGLIAPQGGTAPPPHPAGYGEVGHGVGQPMSMSPPQTPPAAEPPASKLWLPD